MIQSGEAAIRDITIFGNILLKIAKKGTNTARSLGKVFLDKQTDKFHKKYVTGEGLGTTLTSNELKEFIKVYKTFYKNNHLGNREILLKGTTITIIIF